MNLLDRCVTRRHTRAMLVLLVLLAGAAAWTLHSLQRDQQINHMILAGELPADRRQDLARQRPELRFTHALALARQGDPDGAMKLFRALQGDTPLGQQARFNTAHLLLQQATQVRASNQPGQAIPLVELAKETLREVLRVDPGHWDARYNLERAQRLLPDPEDDDLTPPAAPSATERAATTMRGVSQGLP